MTAPPHISLLEDKVINQIAAGEVVERPASVVKELVENSLDAEATLVEVSIEEGGAKSIAILDNGRGIPPDELKLAVQRHATSKITGVDDLQTIATYGFRGEALPSIASVSTLRISSRVESEELAHYLLLESGRQKESGLEVSGRGTRILVSDLFATLPARRKFLKTEQTETAHIQDSLMKFALANPKVHFRLFNKGRMVFDFPPESTLLERAKAVLKRRGRGAIRATLTHAKVAPMPETHVEMVLAPPEISLRDASGCYLFVNGRSVKDRLLLRTLTGGYGSLLERGRYPVAVLSLHLPSAQVDVNVHPQKTEIRFLHERAVAGMVRHTVTETLSQAPWTPLQSLEEPHSHTAPAQQTTPRRRYQLQSPAAEEPETYAATRSRILESIKASATTEALRGAKSPPRAFRGRTGASPSGQAPPREHAGSGPSTQPPLPTFSGKRPQQKLPTAPQEENTARYLGTHGDLYLVFSVGEKLLIVDQHAAHERIRYATIAAQLEQQAVKSQGLLFPETVTLKPEQYELAMAHHDLLEGAGLQFQRFGPNTVVVRSLPAILHNPDIKALLEDILEEIETGGTGKDLGGIRDTIAATMACHSAVRKGDRITPAEALDLLYQLETVSQGGHCPHGRPVSFTLDRKEIETRFKRR